MKIAELNSKKLAETLLMAPLSSFMANHKKIQYTMQDYILPSEDNLEAQFIHDLFTKDTQYIIDKWYGGEDGARELVMRKQP
jgi:hypothetical protein